MDITLKDIAADEITEDIEGAASSQLGEDYNRVASEVCSDVGFFVVSVSKHLTPGDAGITPQERMVTELHLVATAVEGEEAKFNLTFSLAALAAIPAAGEAGSTTDNQPDQPQD